MDRQFKVIYKDYQLECPIGPPKWVETIKEDIVPWGLEYYDESISYRDNLSAISVAIFDAGFVEVKPGKIVNTACILQLLEVQSQSQQERPQQNGQSQQAQQNGQQRKDNRDNRGGKFRKMRRFDKNQQPKQDAPKQEQTEQKQQESKEQVAQPPPKPEPPPNVLLRESEDFPPKCADDYEPIS